MPGNVSVTSSSDELASSNDQNMSADMYKTPSQAKTSMAVPSSNTVSPTTNNSIFAASSLAARRFTIAKSINLNARTLNEEYNSSPRKKVSVRSGMFPQSPWYAGLEHPHRDESASHSMLISLSSTVGEKNR